MRTRPRVLLVDNQDSYTWNLYQLFWCATGVEPVVVSSDNCDPELLDDGRFSHLVVGPGPGTPHNPADVGGSARLMAAAAIPVLGVCLGHQVLAVIYGGQVVAAPQPVHGLRSRIRHAGTGIFAGVPDGFAAVRYHSLAVAEPVPADLVVTARADDDQVVMALRHRTRPLFGLQFHPESIDSEHGAVLVRNFLATSALAEPHLVASTTSALTR